MFKSECWFRYVENDEYGDAKYIYKYLYYTYITYIILISTRKIIKSLILN